MFRSWPLYWYVIFGLLLWGLPACIILGPHALELTLLTCLPVMLICRKDRASLLAAGAADIAGRQYLQPNVSMLLAGISVLYMIYDSILGTQALSQNMFLYHTAFEKNVDHQIEMIGKGRGMADLLATLFQFMPFILVDASKRSVAKLRLPMLIVATALVFYTAGVGRGPLLIAAFSIFLGIGRFNLWRLIIAVAFAVGIFEIASLARGDWGNVTFGNPAVDAVVWPYINLGLLDNLPCGQSSTAAFVVEFFKKFVPGFLFDKHLYSFNSEMSLCLYPSADGSYESVSIFTYLGEYLYYRPSVLTALCAGVIVGVLTRITDRLMCSSQLVVTRIFTGLIFAELLRSRISDVYSFALFVMIWGVFFLIVSPPKRSGREIAESDVSASQG